MILRGSCLNEPYGFPNTMPVILCLLAELALGLTLAVPRYAGLMERELLRVFASLEVLVLKVATPSPLVPEFVNL